MGAAAIKYQLILKTSTGSLARFHTRHKHFVLDEGYEGLYQRLCLCADNESTKQSPETVPAPVSTAMMMMMSPYAITWYRYLDSSLLGYSSSV
jgi:hypothetical protein